MYSTKKLDYNYLSMLLLSVLSNVIYSSFCFKTITDIFKSQIHLVMGLSLITELQCRTYF